MTLTAEIARALFEYNEQTGVLVNRVTRGASKAGRVAGVPHHTGYLNTTVNYKHVLVHRVIWLIKTGAYPKHSIDHIDMNKTNNRWSNLREATGSQQNGNKGLMSNNKSGWKGVRKSKNRWQALLTLNGKQRLVGSFETAEEAVAARAEAAREQFGEFYNHG